MPKVLINRTDHPEEWERLHSLWIEQGRPGYVVGGGGEQYRVHRPGDDTILFEKQGGIDDLYATRSTRGIAK